MAAIVRSASARAAAAKSSPLDAYSTDRDALSTSPAPAGRDTGTHRRLDVATLHTDAGHEDRQLTHEPAHGAELVGVRRADDEATLAVLGPPRGDHHRHPLVERAAADVEVLQFAAAGVARAADREHGTVGQQRRGRVGAEVGAVGHRIGAVSPERLAGVELGGRADVAALGVEDDRHVWVTLVDVRAHALQRTFGPLGGEVSDLRLERAHEVGRRVHDVDAEAFDRGADVGRHHRVDRLGQVGRVGVEPDAQHRARRRPGRRELGVEAAHAAQLFAARKPSASAAAAST